MIKSFFLCFLVGGTATASWKSAGRIQTYFRQYAFASTSEYSSQSGGLEAELKLDWKGSENWRMRSDLEVRTDYASRDSSEQFQFHPQQLYLENRSTLKTRLGFQTWALDGPDLLNPADVVQSKNWRDPSQPRTLSSAGISLAQEVESWQWEFFYIPEQTQPLFPGDRSAWWPREKKLPIESEDRELQIPAEVRYKVIDGQELDRALRHNMALRIMRKSEKWEGQLLLFEGLANAPFLLTEATGTLISAYPQQILLLESPVKLRPLYYRQQAAALTFVLPFESFAIQGGAHALKPLGGDSRLPGPSTTAVLGVEKNFETRHGITTLLLQHESQKKQAENQLSFLRSLFQDAWSFGFRVPWGEELQFLGGVLYDTIGKSSLYRFSGERKLSETWSLGLEGQSLQGPSDSLLGLYDRYDHLGVSLTSHF